MPFVTLQATCDFRVCATTFAWRELFSVTSFLVFEWPSNDGIFDMAFTVVGYRDAHTRPEANFMFKFAVVIARVFVAAFFFTKTRTEQ